MFARLSSAQEIPIDPPFQRAKFSEQDLFLSLKKRALITIEGKGEIFTIHNERGGS